MEQRSSLEPPEEEEEDDSPIVNGNGVAITPGMTTPKTHPEGLMDPDLNHTKPLHKRNHL